MRRAGVDLSRRLFSQTPPAASGAAHDYNQRVRVTDLKYLKQKRTLCVTFDKQPDTSFSLPAEYLRVFSPSAEVQGHSPDQKKVVSGRRFVGIIGIEPVGHYAVRLVFDDLHDSGIYSWDYLNDLASNKFHNIKDYLRQLKRLGRSRDPPRRPSSSSSSSSSETKQQ